MNKKGTIITIVIIVAVAAAIGYFLWYRPAMAPASPVTPSSATTTTTTAAAPAAPKWNGDLYYTTPSTLMKGGNFSFMYLSGTSITKNALVSGKHEIVLTKSGSAGGTLYINVSPCSAYATCKEVSGIPIGTNATGSDMQKLFDAVTGSFTSQ